MRPIFFKPIARKCVLSTDDIIIIVYVIRKNLKTRIFMENKYQIVTPDKRAWYYEYYSA